MSEIDLNAAMADGDEQTEESFEEIGTRLLDAAGIKNRVFFEERGPSGTWWCQGKGGCWQGRNSRLFDSYLKSKGINAVRGKEEVQSDLERAVLHISLNEVVQYAGPIAGYYKGVHQNNGKRVLVTRGPQIPTPTLGEFDTIRMLIDQMFGAQGDENIDQRPYFLGYWKHALECLLYPRVDHRGLCLVLAGEAECGKSLIKDLMKVSLGGRECKPYRFMIGQENFNGEFIGSELWVIDDEQAQTDHRSRSELGANIKKTVAERVYRIRGMMRDDMTLDMYRRLIICVNREPERLMVLPQLENDIADKMSILLTHKHEMPMECRSTEGRALFWETLTEELPHFLHWLLNEYEITKEFEGRFGIKHYHHPDLCRDLFEMSRELVLWEQIQKTLFGNLDTDFDGCTNWYHESSATDLRNLMAAESAPLTTNEKNKLPPPNHFGKCLSKIADQYPQHIIQRKRNGTNRWIITDLKHDILTYDEIKGGRHD